MVDFERFYSAFDRLNAQIAAAEKLLKRIPGADQVAVRTNVDHLQIFFEPLAAAIVIATIDDGGLPFSPTLQEQRLREVKAAPRICYAAYIPELIDQVIAGMPATAATADAIADEINQKLAELDLSQELKQLE